MTQNDVQAHPVPRGIRYQLMYPPGWREFGTSSQFEDALVKLVTAEPKALGRADIVLMLRQKMHELFENLRRRGSLGFALPVNRINNGVWPVSLIVTPLKVSSTGTVTDAVRHVAGRNPVETQQVEGANWYLWQTSGRSKEAHELQTNGINLVVPRPMPDGSVDPDPKAGLWLAYSYISVEGTTSEEMNEGLRELGLAMLGTFKWVPVQ